MINIKYIDYISSKSGVKNRELIEKDFILHSLLVSLAKEKYFSSNFVFKGGTCLIKCYLGYFRFSEDLDFTYINQNAFKSKSEKSIRKFLSLEIDQLLGILINTSKTYNLDFKADKDNPRYIEYGGSNKFVTFKIWYVSALNKREQFIKIQLNFVELFKYEFKKLEAKLIVKDINKKEIAFLFPEYSSILVAPKLKVYDIREILLEKMRAVLTRREIKSRDFVDIYMITQMLKRDIRKFRKDILLKTRFMLKYEKYKQNLEEKSRVKVLYKPGEEAYLLLRSLDGFQHFVNRLSPFLNELITDLLKNS